MIRHSESTVSRANSPRASFSVPAAGSPSAISARRRDIVSGQSRRSPVTIVKNGPTKVCRPNFSQSLAGDPFKQKPEFGTIDPVASHDETD
jgi:hypothetical protein